MREWEYGSSAEDRVFLLILKTTATVHQPLHNQETNSPNQPGGMQSNK